MAWRAALLAAGAAAGPPPLPPDGPGGCVVPATCSPPQAQYSMVRPVQSRSQWEDSGGYCGALAVQSIAMSYGVWVSQDQVRKAAGAGKNGKMVMHYNIVKALNTLKLTHDDWDHAGAPVPQYEEYLAWLKESLAAGHPVVWMIMTKEIGSHAAQAAGLPLYTHIEPVWGVYSNHSLTDAAVYPDDVLVHGADYGALGATEGAKLYRRFDSLMDTALMTGNCSKAVAGVGNNEYYPCILRDTDFGYAITGVVEPSGASLPLSLAVDLFDEPDFPWTSAVPVPLHGTVTVTGLEAGQQYVILRWDDYRNVPTDGAYLSSSFDQNHTFTAAGATYVFKDPATFLNSGTTYYRAVKAA